MEDGRTVFHVTAKTDFLAGQASAPPLMAIAECVWNALDADAMRVDVELHRSPLGGLDRIVVRDDGTAMTRAEAPALFQSLGGSWKSLASKTRSGQRFLHGRYGRGRFKAFALGRVADWSVTFLAIDGLKTFKVNVLADDMGKGTITAPTESHAEHTGVELMSLSCREVAIRQKELTQVEDYARAVAADSRFDKTTTRGA